MGSRHDRLPSSSAVGGADRQDQARVAHRAYNRPRSWVPATRQLPKPEWSCAATSAAGEILPRAAQAKSRPEPLLAVSATAATAPAM